MSKYRLVKLIVVFFAAIISLSVFSGFDASSKAALNSKCNLEDGANLRGLDFNSLEKKEIKILGESAEGGIAYLYEKEGALHGIRSVFLGETGKTEFNYFFDLSERRRYLVEMTDYRYTVPIYVPDFKIASKSVNTFVVCEGLKSNYPKSSDLEGAYSRAVSILEIIRFSQKKVVRKLTSQQPNKNSSLK